MSAPIDGSGNDNRHGMFERFVHSEVSGSMVLLACTIVALVWANSPWAESYFALVNSIDTNAVSYLLEPVGLGIILGLFVGKQVGITLFSWLAIRGGYADMPEGVTWGQIWGAACLGGVGFTMAIFIGELAFTGDLLIAKAKLAILFASVASGVFGFLVLRRVLPKS